MKSEHDNELELNCLIDHEVGIEEHIEIMSAMEEDDDMRLHACSLMHQKELVKLAYADIAPPDNRKRTIQPWMGIAATVVLALGATLAWFAHGPAAQNAVTTPDNSRMVLLDPDGSGQKLADPAREETRIVFQVTNPDYARATEILDEIESTLNYYKKSNKPVRIELVAHGDGLTLLRKRLSKHAERIAALSERFHNLTFVACMNTVKRISNEQGFDVDILPHVVLIDSGVNHIAQRQQEGWAYIQL